MEAAGLAVFVISASILTTLLEYPASPLHRAIESRFLRQVALGVPMGLVVAAIVYSPWGQRSGAHINPAVTWAFFRLGKIGLWDAVFYSLAQFGGAAAAVLLMREVIGRAYAHPAVNYAVTRPGPGGQALAFLGEFAISFVLMIVVLVTINSRRLKKLTGMLTGLLIAAYLALETPLSGMSLNPARSFGSAFVAGQWSSVWVYFAAPTAAMLLAAEIYGRMRRGQTLACAKLHHGNAGRCIFCNNQRGPTYPVEAET